MNTQSQDMLNLREQGIRTAALIDTDGSIYINRLRRGQDYTPVCTVFGQLRRHLYWLKECWGGSICVNRKTGSRSSGITNNYTCYEWRVTGRKACLLLKAAMPFLLLKRNQADCALRAGIIKDRKDLARDDKICLLQELSHEMKCLNSKVEMFRRDQQIFDTA